MEDLEKTDKKNDELKVGKPYQYLWIIICGALFGLIPMGIQGSCLGVYYTALSETFSVPVSSISLYIAIGGIGLIICYPLVGKLYAKYDLRHCLAVFVILYGIVLFVASQAPNQPTFVICGALLVVGSCMIFNLGMPTLINRWFKDYSGTIIGICAAMTGFGGTVLIPVGSAVMQSGVDYHTPFIVYGIITIVVLLPIVLFGIRSYPADRGLLPYVSKKTVNSMGSAAEAVKEKNWTVDVSKTMKTSAFWTFVIGLGLANFVVLVTRFFATSVNDLASAGVAVFVSGAVLATCLSTGQGIAKLIMGFFTDLIKAGPVVVVASISGIICLLLIWFCPTNFLLPVGGFGFGFYYCSVSVLGPIIAGKLFGTGENYSIIFSRANSIASIFVLPAGVAWPWIAENFGGYGTAFALAIAMIVLFAICWLAALRTGHKIEHVEDTTTVVDAQ